MSSYPIEAIEGIGKVYGKKLSAVGITTTGALLNRAATPKGRRALGEASGIDDGRILKFANLADLMRVKGVAIQYSELLEAAGVDTVKELRNRRADNLQAKMAEVNAAKKLVRAVPSLSAVTKWVAEAKAMKPVLKY